MRPRPVPVWQIAKEIGIDADIVLLATWELGQFEDRALNVLNSKDKIPDPLVDKVRRSLGIATRRELHTVTYWCNLLGMSMPELRIKLSEEGYSLSPKQRKLPPGTRFGLSTDVRVAARLLCPIASTEQRRLQPQRAHPFRRRSPRNKASQMKIERDWIGRIVTRAK